MHIYFSSPNEVQPPVGSSQEPPEEELNDNIKTNTRQDILFSCKSVS